MGWQVPYLLALFDRQRKTQAKLHPKYQLLKPKSPMISLGKGIFFKSMGC
jgi:hypothetical protein